MLGTECTNKIVPQNSPQFKTKDLDHPNPIKRTGTLGFNALKRTDSPTRARRARSSSPRPAFETFSEHHPTAPRPPAPPQPRPVLGGSVAAAGRRPACCAASGRSPLLRRPAVPKLAGPIPPSLPPLSPSARKPRSSPPPPFWESGGYWVRIRPLPRRIYASLSQIYVPSPGRHGAALLFPAALAQPPLPGLARVEALAGHAVGRRCLCAALVDALAGDAAGQCCFCAARRCWPTGRGCGRGGRCSSLLLSLPASFFSILFQIR
ncbi:hypothetical protein PVAP13_9NG190673 [Panicum virgatum]|uniref:Uncharacterized protein n=1 Tax=Panicum virgatum TaxID=38727 RepID=A0A8T0MNZ5_PANVG|nr:hypothetical protein PVAP13_9NG190673 [Panicum virgatum]